MRFFLLLTLISFFPMLSAACPNLAGSYSKCKYSYSYAGIGGSADYSENGKMDISQVSGKLGNDLSFSFVGVEKVSFADEFSADGVPRTKASGETFTYSCSPLGFVGVMSAPSGKADIKMIKSGTSVVYSASIEDFNFADRTYRIVCEK